MKRAIPLAVILLSVGSWLVHHEPKHERKQLLFPYSIQRGRDAFDRRINMDTSRSLSTPLVYAPTDEQEEVLRWKVEVH